ncbi:MAG: cysteine hydrolase [Actinomycetota bacterium]
MTFRNQRDGVFTLDPGKAAFVIIDMQNSSCVPSSGNPLPHIREVIDKINLLADFCRGKRIPVIWVRHSIASRGKSNDAGLYTLFHQEARIQDMMNRSRGTELFPDMHFSPSRDHVVFKNRYSAFLSQPPELEQKLQLLRKSQILVAGIAANACVESTVRDAMQLDYEVVLVSDGTTAANESLLRVLWRTPVASSGMYLAREK